MCNVKMSESKILESVDENLIESKINDEVTMRKELGLSVRRSGTRITRRHVNTIENLLVKGSMRLEKTLIRT